MSTLIGVFLVIIAAVAAVLTFAMANAAGRYDDLSEQIYREELSRRELEDALNNPEYISPEQKQKARRSSETPAASGEESNTVWS